MKKAKKMNPVTMKTWAAAWMLVITMVCGTVNVSAATPLNSENFDSKSYADTYADLKAAFGYDHNMLWKHYQMFGANEKRKAYATNGDVGYLGTAQTAASAGNASLNANNFDYIRYADTYADLKAAFGYDKAKLWKHYQTFGAKEGRQVFAIGSTAAPVARVAATPAASALVPLSEIKKMPTFSRHMNDAEMEAVYAILKPVAEQLTGLSKKDQVKAVVRYVAKVPYRYSMSVQHCYDPYGLLVNGYASCTGHTRTVGFLLSLLGIPYQHINEERYTHQWARVQIDGVWYCCDGQIGLMMEETAPGSHPAFPGKTLYTDRYGNYCVG